MNQIITDIMGEPSGSVVECLTRDRGAAGSSLTGVTALWYLSKVSKGAKIRSRYNQVPHPTQDTNGKVTNSQLDTTNESQEVSPFPAGDHKAQINRRAQRHSKHKTEQKHKRSTMHIYPSLVLVQPRKTRPCLTERLLIGRKESNETNKQTDIMVNQI